jgi:hypothetical protein
MLKDYSSFHTPNPPESSQNLIEKRRMLIMPNPKPSVKDWKELYQAATDFMKIKPWAWLSDSDLFGVQNPQNGEIGYCCIMGELAEVYALAVYLGSEGLESYLKIQTGAIDADDPDVLHIQKCLVASFEDRESLEKEDLQTIKKLGLRFRGSRAWPQFRSYLPGYVPWFVTKEEARFLALALQQAIEVALRSKEDSGILKPPKRGLVLVRVPGLADEKAGWEDVWVKPLAPEKDDQPVAPVDELRVQRIKKHIRKRTGTWEIDFFYFPAPVQQGERPYFPRTGIIIDHNKGFVLHNWLAPPWSFFYEFRESLLSFVEKNGILPKRILVSKPESLWMLNSIAAALSIDLKMVDMLEGINELRTEMDAHFLGMPQD